MPAASVCLRPTVRPFLSGDGGGVMTENHVEGATRRGLIAAAGMAGMAGMAAALSRGAAAAPNGAGGGATPAGTGIAPSILDYLGDLDLATKELAKTWKPDDPHYRADVYRQTVMNLAYAYFVMFHA